MEPGMYVHTGEGWLGIGAVLLHACSQEGEATPPPLVSQAQENTSFQLTAPRYTLGATLILGMLT